jgi:hypothetical protein
MNQLSITLGRAQWNMKQAGISAATLAKLCDLQPSTLSAAFRSVVRLDSQKEAELLRTTLDIQELQDALRPFREPTNFDDLRLVLDFINANNITPNRIRHAMSDVFGIAGAIE